MSLFNKILIFLGIITMMSAMSFIIYKQNEMSNRQIAIETHIINQKELSDNITRSQNEYATKDDIEEFAKNNNVNLQTIQKDLDKLRAILIAINTVTAHSSGQTTNNLPSSGTDTINPNPSHTDTFGYLERTQVLDIHEDFNNVDVPLGQIGFSAWQPAPWNINILPREYKVTNIIGTDENQRTYVYNKFTIKVDDKDYEVKIATAETKQEFPEAKWNLWNPRLFVGIDGGINIEQIEGEFSPNLNVSVISHGRYKNQPDFSVLQIGAGFGITSQKPQIAITPIAYNIGKHIPLMNNTYIAPSLQINTDANISAMAGIRVGL